MLRPARVLPHPHNYTWKDLHSALRPAGTAAGQPAPASHTQPAASIHDASRWQPSSHVLWIGPAGRYAPGGVETRRKSEIQ
jgi:hypothetical protein